MYDRETFKNARGNSLDILYIHGRSSDGKGGSEDVTHMVFIAQSADGRVFNTTVYNEEDGDGMRRDYLNRRGYVDQLTDVEINAELDIEFDNGESDFDHLEDEEM